MKNPQLITATILKQIYLSIYLSKTFPYLYTFYTFVLFLRKLALIYLFL